MLCSCSCRVPALAPCAQSQQHPQGMSCQQQPCLSAIVSYLHTNYASPLKPNLFGKLLAYVRTLALGSAYRPSNDREVGIPRARWPHWVGHSEGPARAPALQRLSRCSFLTQCLLRHLCQSMHAIDIQCAAQPHRNTGMTGPSASQPQSSYSNAKALRVPPVQWWPAAAAAHALCPAPAPAEERPQGRAQQRLQPSTPPARAGAWQAGRCKMLGQYW